MTKIHLCHINMTFLFLLLTTFSAEVMAVFHLDKNYLHLLVFIVLISRFYSNKEMTEVH